jgi:hypothetical protein
MARVRRGRCDDVLRPAAPPAPLLDVIGEQAAQPERVVPQVGADEEAPPRVRVVHVLAQRGERLVDLVVGVADARRAVAQPEVQQDRRDVVGEAAVRLAVPHQRVPHGDVGEQAERGVRALRQFHEGRQEPRIVEQRVEPLLPEGGLRALELRARAAGDQAQRQLRVVTGE